MAVIDLSVGNFLAFQQGRGERNNHIHEVVATGLSIAQLARWSHLLITLNQPWNINQDVERSTVLHLSAANALQLNQVMGPTKYGTVSNVLYLQQVGAKGQSPVATSKLNLVQLAFACRPLFETLTIHQTLSTINILHLANSQSITLSSEVCEYKVDALGGCQAVDPTPVVLIAGYSLMLKIPEIGDSDSIELSRVQELTRGGDLIVYSDPVWPKTEILKFNFVSMSQNLAKQLLKFLNDFIGQGITLIDHQGVSWFGVILNPESPITCYNDQNCGDYSIELRFQGDRV